MSPTGLWKGRVLPKPAPLSQKHDDNFGTDNSSDNGDRKSGKAGEEKGKMSGGRVGNFKFIYVRVCSRMDEAPDVWRLAAIR